MFRRLRFLQKPWITAALLAVMLCDAWVISAYPRSSTMGGILGAFNRPGCRHYGYPGEKCFVSVENGELVTLLPYEDLDEILLLTRTKPDVLYQMWFDFISDRHGFWAPWVVREGFTSRISREDGAPVDQAMEARIRTAVIDRIELAMGPGLQPWMQQDFLRRYVDWTGFAHNAGALLAFIGLLASVGWVPEARVRHSMGRRRYELSRGRCPRCGYATTALPEPRCPECGEEWSADLPLTPGTSATETTSDESSSGP